jgi:sec-independent protein translocase protein TatC
MAVVPFPDPQNQNDRDRWDDADEREAGGKMSFLEHLDEFRKRLIRALISLAIGVALSVFFVDKILAFIMVPLQQMLSPGHQFIYTEPTEAFLLYLKAALMSGLIIASPFIALQIWLFVAPGLYANEKKFAVPFILFMTVGFVGGAAFSHYVVFPLMWQYLASFDNQFLTFTPRIAPSFSLYMRMMIGTALIFQMPTLVFALARMGVVTPRWMVRNFKYAVLISFIVSAVVTPGGDPMSQALLAGPMCGLYVLSIGIAWIFGKRRKTEEES